MSSGVLYPAPTENLPTFNPEPFIPDTTGLTVTSAKQYFLEFPVAQGPEFFSDITVGGLGTFESSISIVGTPNVDYLQFPDNTKQYTAATSGGGGNVITTSNNTFLSPATIQTFDTQNVVISNGLLSLTNGTTIPIYGNGGNTNLYFPSSFPSGSQGSNAGLGFYWNNLGGGGSGETDLICYGQNGVGGLSIYTINGGSIGPASLISSFLTSGISFNTNITSNNIFTGTNTFQSTFTIDNTLSNIGQYTNNNTGIGFETLPSFTTGNYNSAFGYQSLNSLTTGSSNTALGYQSLTTLISGDLNTSIGWGALAQNISDNNNTAIGYASGFNLVGNGTNSDFNIFVGYNAGFYQTSGSNNIAIGQFSGVDSTTPTISDTIAIGNITATDPFDIILGSSNINYVKFNCNAYNYELSAYNNNLGIANNDLYVNGFAQQPSTSTPTYLPTSYGTFYNNGGLPYFAYNNAGTINYTSLSSPFITFQWAVSTISGNSIWQGFIPSSISMNSFSFTFSTNIQSTNVSLNGGATITSNNTQFSGFGVASRQNYTSGGNNQYGYIFTILSYTGAPNPSPNLSMFCTALDPPNPSFGQAYGKLINLIDGGFYYGTGSPANPITFTVTKTN